MLFCSRLRRADFIAASPSGMSTISAMTTPTKAFGSPAAPIATSTGRAVLSWLVELARGHPPPRPYHESSFHPAQTIRTMTAKTNMLAVTNSPTGCAVGGKSKPSSDAQLTAHHVVPQHFRRESGGVALKPVGSRPCAHERGNAQRPLWGFSWRWPTTGTMT
jgi:hypothetical protein